MEKIFCLGGEKGLGEKWEATPREEGEGMNPLVYTLTKTIHDFRGIERGEKSEQPDLDKQHEQWRGAHGDEVARQLLELAENALPHYGYLASFKI
ncbi:hypothetical protein AC578_7524 [Pseudocercospora eumusae]|uniref:Uncharacterized protein n=1 Tax=Pseudocercospora eumusae TaxID=321146 RepID=A0A139GWI5_9PEZI|nr:hypothetical protein AC578_7524 [Pseudocercospora eumusae]